MAKATTDPAYQEYPAYTAGGTGSGIPGLSKTPVATPTTQTAWTPPNPIFSGYHVDPSLTTPISPANPVGSGRPSTPAIPPAPAGPAAPPPGVTAPKDPGFVIPPAPVIPGGPAMPTADQLGKAPTGDALPAAPTAPALNLNGPSAPGATPQTQQTMSGDLWARLLPQIQQYEATTGRKISPTALRAMSENEFQAAADRAAQNKQLAQADRGLDLQQYGLDLNKFGITTNAQLTQFSQALQKYGITTNAQLAQQDQALKAYGLDTQNLFQGAQLALAQHGQDANIAMQAYAQQLQAAGMQADQAARYAQMAIGVGIANQNAQVERERTAAAVLQQQNALDAQSASGFGGLVGTLGGAVIGNWIAPGIGGTVAGAAIGGSAGGSAGSIFKPSDIAYNPDAYSSTTGPTNLTSPYGYAPALTPNQGDHPVDSVLGPYPNY